MTNAVTGEEVRYAALKALREVGSESVDAERLRALGDASFRVRAEAVDQLATRPVSAFIEEALVAGLGAGENAGLRNAACDLMVRYGGKIVAAVARAARSSDADVRKLAIDVAGEIAEPTLVPILLGALEDANVNVRIAAAEALGSFNSAEATEALTQGLDDGELVFELACLESLARRSAEVSAARLSRHLKDPYQRRAALAVLGATPGVEAITALAEGLLDERPSTRAVAVRAIAKWLTAADCAASADRDVNTRQLRAAVPLDREEATLGRIEALLENAACAAEATVVVGRLGFARSAVPLALAAKQSPDLEPAVDAALKTLDACAADELARALRQAGAEDWVWIVRALDVLGDVRGASAVLARCERGSEPDRHLIDALSHVSDPRAISILVRCARSADGDVSDAAVLGLRSLAKKHPRGVAAHFAALSDDEYRDARCAEVEGGLGSHADGARLLRFLDRGPNEVRAHALGALAELRSTEAFSKVRALSLNAAPGVRLAAIAALGAYGAASLDAADLDVRRAGLVALLRDLDAQIRSAAAAALSGDDAAETVKALSTVLRGDDLTVAIAAVRALASIASRGVEAAWREVLAFASAEAKREDRSTDNPLAVEVWKEALAALSAPPVPAAFEILTDALSDPRWDVRAAAARALGARRDRNAFAPLRARLQRENDLTARRALEAALVDLARETRGF